MDSSKRKGSRSTKDTPTEIIHQLNMGEIESANLVEWLAVNQRDLLRNLLNKTKREKYFLPILR